MSQTPNSSGSSYLSAAGAIQHFDVRRWGQLVNDDNTAATAADLKDPTTAAGATFQTHLDAAGGQVEAACSKGQRYVPADLAALTGVSARFLQRLVACLAFGSLKWRREPDKEPPPVLLWAERQLAALESGAEIFAFAQTEAAGVGAVSTDTFTDPATDTITGVAARLFGDRSFPGP